jgi:hypothetical protein
LASGLDVPKHKILIISFSNFAFTVGRVRNFASPFSSVQMQFVEIFAINKPITQLSIRKLQKTSR